jgi:DNA-binding beta-propeller fold protein YncE
VVPLPPTGDAHQPAGLARLGDDLYVTLTPTLPSKSPAVVRRLDGRTLATLGEATTRPASNVIVADPAHDRLYVSNSDGDTISRFDHQLAPIDPLTVPPGPLGLLLAGGRLWIAGYYGNAIAAVDLDGAGAQPPSAAPAIVNPTHLALAPDGGALWVVSSGTVGALLELDPSTGAERRSVPLGALPFDVIALPSSTEKE